MRFNFDELNQVLDDNALRNGISLNQRDKNNFDAVPGFLTAETDPVVGRRNLTETQAQHCHDLLKDALSGEPDEKGNNGWARYAEAVNTYLSQEEERIKKVECWKSWKRRAL